MKDLLIVVIALAGLWYIFGDKPSPEIKYTIEPVRAAIEQPTAVPPMPPTPEPIYIAPAQPAPQPIVQPAPQQPQRPLPTQPARVIFVEVTPETWFADAVREQNTLKAQTGIGHPDCHAPMICDE